MKKKKKMRIKNQKKSDFMNDNAILYRIVRPIVTFIFKIFFRPTYVGLENIPDKKIIFAGNHTSNLDCILLMSSTKRSIHFLAKIELFKGLKGIIFKNMGLIPVDRFNRTTTPLDDAKKYLDIDGLILIFPEGTTEKGRGLLKFKKGAVTLAKDTNTKIVPFVIRGKYKLFRKNITLEILKEYEINDDIKDENEKLRKIIQDKLEG